MDRRTLLTTLAATAAASAAPWARAQNYPEQLIKWVVPYPAGGGTDVIARTLAEAMRQTLGQQIVIDNRPGASTNIGADLVAKSKPDGYTVMSADNALLAFNEYLFTKLPFNPEKDFTYIGAIGKFPLALVVHPDFPAKDFKSFLAYAKANPGKLNYGSAGNGSSHHLAGELFKLETKTFITHIPYKGAGPALSDLIAGQVDIVFDGLGSSAQHIRSNRINALAVAATKRSPSFPNVPTAAEVGVKNFEVSTWYAMWVPKNTPKDVVDKLYAETRKALDSPEMKAVWLNNGSEIPNFTPEQFGQFQHAEIKRWAEVVQRSGAKID